MRASKISPKQFSLFSNKRLVFFSFLFLGSGAAGLIYQIIWERLLELFFGVTMTAITLIVAAYMAGLGLGALFGGRLAGKQKSNLLYYAFLELGIGVFGLVSQYLILKTGELTAGSPYWLVFILSFFLLLIPTFLMGMTLPLLSQAFIQRIESSGKIIGILYGINTAGAAFGCLVTGYFLIGFFGIRESLYVASAINISIGILAMFASRYNSEKSPEPDKQAGIIGKSKRLFGYYKILIASFLVGFIGLGYEMLWIRILSVANKNTAYGFPSILFVFLIGLSIGAYFWGHRADRSKNIERLFWNVEIAVGLVASLTFFTLWISLKQDLHVTWLGDFWYMQKPVPPFVEIDKTLVFSRRVMLFNLYKYFLPILLLILPTSFLLGGGLPILDRYSINNLQIAGRRIGEIHLANIIGSVFGSLAISFLLLPNIGSENTHKILVLLSFIFPILFLTRNNKQKVLPNSNQLSSVLIIVSLLLLIIIPGKGKFYSQLFQTAVGNPAIVHETGETVLALTVDRNTVAPEWLWIGGETNSFYPPDGTYEGRALLCAGASHPKRILVIGMGGGITANFFQSIPEIENIIIVELISDLEYFLYDHVDLVRHTLDNPRVEYIVDDGRRYLNANPSEKFDLIYSDPLRRYSAGHNNLYSREAMNLYKAHLTNNGVFCAYVDQQNVIPKTIASSFAEVDQFRFRTVIASNQSLQYDVAYMETIMENYLIASEAYYDSTKIEAIQPEYLLSKYIRSSQQILSDERKNPVLTDNDPWLEYYFFNEPNRMPVWSKGSSSEDFLNRIVNDP